MEIWKDMILREKDENINKKIECNFKISSYGRVYNKISNRFISHVMTGKPPYWYVNLRYDKNRVILRRVHNIMAHTFLGEPPSPQHTCDHIDQNKYNNSLGNLRWLGKKGQMRNRAITLRTVEGLDLIEMSDKYNLPYALLRLCFYEGLDSEKSLVKEAKILHKYGKSVGEVVVRERGNSIRLFHFLEAFNKTSEEVLPLLRKGFSLTDIIEDKIYATKESIPDIDTIKSLEYQGVWYPYYKEALPSLGIQEYRWSSGKLDKNTSNELRLQEILKLKEESENRGKVQVGDHFMTVKEHCERVGTSYGRVSTLMQKKGLSLEEALSCKPEKIIKHTINGNVKRNKAWFEYFGISPRTANGYLCKHGHDFRKTLEYYGIDTTDMEIEPFI